MTSRELLKCIIDACISKDFNYHIPANLYCAALEEIERPEPDPVAWRRTDTARSVITENSFIADGWKIDGLFFEPLYTEQPDQSARISELEEELEQYRNPKNWTRSYDYKGDLIAEHALFRPKLKTGK